MRRVAHLIDTNSLGGAEALVATMCRYLRDYEIQSLKYFIYFPSQSFIWVLEVAFWRVKVRLS